MAHVSLRWGCMQCSQLTTISKRSMAHAQQPHGLQPSAMPSPALSYFHIAHLRGGSEGITLEQPCKTEPTDCCYLCDA